MTEEGAEKLWHRVDEFGGVKALSDSFGFSPSKMYNWRNKELALPVKFVRRIMGENSTSEIVLLKGPSSGGKIRNPVFPLNISPELLTRVESSVSLNSEGTPFYIVSEKSLVERFASLLEELGEVSYTIYSRDSRFELRYPIFLQAIFSQSEFEEDIAALVDEEGEFDQHEIILSDRKIPIDDFEGKLYSREKRFELALQRGDSDKIAELMSEESSKVRSLIG